MLFFHNFCASGRRSSFCIFYISRTIHYLQIEINLVTANLYNLELSFPVKTNFCLPPLPKILYKLLKTYLIPLEETLLM